MRSKKTIVLAAASASLLAVTAFGTLAYFTADNEATNTFMVASTDDPSDELFGVTVTEDVTEVPDEIEKNDEGGYTYKGIMPGMTLAKNPNVTNSGQYSEYVRVSVTLDKAGVWKEVLGDDFALTDLVKTVDTGKWEYADTKEDVAANTITWIYYYTEALAAGAETGTMFTEVKIPTGLKTEQMEQFKDGVNMVVKAEAIQSENLTTEEGTAVATPAGAFALFEAQVNGATTEP